MAARSSVPPRRRVSVRAFFALLLALVCLLGNGGVPPSGIVGQPLPGVDNVVCPAYDASTLPAPLPASPSVSAGSMSGSFAVTPGGQATYTLPLVLPPGRLGMEPKLAIAYDSSRGEGPLGVGFGLQGLSTITRCASNMAQDGRIRAVRYDTEDQFCLDGVRLVAVPNPIGRGITHTLEWRTFPDTHRKVISYGGPVASQGPQGWRVYEKDGRVLDYGATADSRAMATGGIVASWHLSTESDRRSNSIEYTYQNTTGPNDLHDEHTVEIDIAQIDYTKHGKKAATRRVKFAYEALPPSTLYQGGLSFTQSNRLVRIDVLTEPGDVAVRRYHLGYGRGRSTGRSLLETLEECDGADVCKPRTTFSWSGAPSILDPLITPVIGQPGLLELARWVLADVNGDGYDDIVVTYPLDDGLHDTWIVSLNQGGFFAPSTVWAILPHPVGAGRADEIWSLTPIDYDQDGNTDIFIDSPDPTAASMPKYRWLKADPEHHTFLLRDTEVDHPDGVYFDPGSSAGPGSDADPYKVQSFRFARLGDIDGDGVADLVECVNPTWNYPGYSNYTTDGNPTWTVRLWVPLLPDGSGPGFDPTPIPIPAFGVLDCAAGMKNVYFVDVDGDGAAEILVPQADDTYGAFQLQNGAWKQIETGLPVQPSWRLIHFLDVNGDGLSDAVYSGFFNCPIPMAHACEPDPVAWPNDVPRQMVTNGKFFGVPTVMLDHSLVAAPDQTDWWGDQAIPIDFDGDGRMDLMLPVDGTCGDGTTNPCYVILRTSPEVQGQFGTAPNALPRVIQTQIPMGLDDYGDPQAWALPQIASVSGNGRHDVVMPNPTFDGSFIVYRNSGPQDLLTGVTDGMSPLDPKDPGFVPTVSIQYGSLVDTSITGRVPSGDQATLDEQPYLKKSDPNNDCAYPRSCVVGPMHVVSSYHLNDGRNEHRTFSVRYRDGRYHRLGRGWLEFGDRIVLDDETGAGRAEHYDNATWDDTLRINPFAGQLVKSWSWSPAAALPTKGSGKPGKPTQVELVYEKTTLQEVPTDPSTFFTLPIVVEEVRREGTFAHTNGQSLYEYVRDAQTKGATTLGHVSTIVSNFDPTSGVVLQQDTVADGLDFDDGVTRVVENDAEHWLLGEVTFEQACSQASGQATQCRTISRTFDGYGQVTGTVTGDLVSPETQLTAAYYRDGFGNVKLTTAYDEAGHYRSACVSYEPEGIFPYAARNQLGHTTLFAYDAGLGALVAAVDPNGQETLVRHDGFGRVTEEQHADGSLATYALSRAKNGGLNGDWWAVKATTNVEGGPSSTRELDSLGRPVRAWAHVAGTKSCGATKCASTLDLVQETTYDHFGRVKRATVPWMQGDALTRKNADTYAYDMVGRLVEHVEPWGRTTTYAYAKNVVTATDWLGPATREVDAVGRTILTKDRMGLTTKTVYGPFSLPHAITRFGKETTTLHRDAYGRVVEEDDPDRGKTVTHYDGFDEVLTVDDAATRHAAFTYDEIGRLVERDDTTLGGSFTTQWAYDTAQNGLGKIAQVTSPDGHTDAYTYTARSQLWTHRLTFADTGEHLDLALGYDGYGRLSHVFYPQPAGVDPLTVRRDYDAFGNVIAVRDDGTGKPFWQVGQLDGAGRPTQETLGNGVTVNHGYAPESGVLQHVHAFLPGTVVRSGVELQRLDYTYDPGLRMASRTDDLQKGSVAGPLTESFGYDPIDRLTCAAVGGWLQTKCAGPIAYDDNGNITAKDGLAYTYDATSQPHAVKTVGGGSYVHDPAGNQIERPDGTTIAYTPFDLPQSYTFQGGTNFLPIASAQFQYDGGQHRIRKTLVTAGGTAYRETAYLDELYERVRDASGDQHRFYVAAGSATVVLTRAVGGNDQLAYLLKDALGSVDVIANGRGEVIERRSYDAFGARRDPKGWGPWQGALASAVTPAGFTGQEEDDEAGLVNMRGRIYDPKIGRFLSTDPIVSRPGFGQSWNPYSYVLNSPLNFTDPSGLQEAPQQPPPPPLPASEMGCGTTMSCTSGPVEHPQPRTLEQLTKSQDKTQDDAPAGRPASPGGGGVGGAPVRGPPSREPNPKLSWLANHWVGFNDQLLREAEDQHHQLGHGGAPPALIGGRHTPLAFVPVAGLAEAVPSDTKEAPANVWEAGGAIAGLKALPQAQFSRVPIATAGATQLTADADALAKAASTIKELPGYFTVVTHADAKVAWVLRDGKWISVSHRSLARFIRGSGWQGERVFLVACKGGACSNGLAQNLANKLGVDVLAPQGDAYIMSDGSVISDVGQWETFVPRGD